MFNDVTYQIGLSFNIGYNLHTACKYFELKDKYNFQIRYMFQSSELSIEGSFYFPNFYYLFEWRPIWCSIEHSIVYSTYSVLPNKRAVPIKRA